MDKGGDGPMIKCPYCGSTAEHDNIDFKTLITEDDVSVCRDYICADCGEEFFTEDIYNKAGYTIVNKKGE
jgi:DNA-directed RNA polymerase subunit RPC12/RpoP